MVLKNTKEAAAVFNTVVGRTFNADSMLYPLQLSWMITKRCNSRCVMCNIWKDKEGHDDLAVKELEELGKSSHLKKLMFLGITGGEPFLRKDMVEAILALSKNMKMLRQITFSTNGTLPDKIRNDVTKLLNSTGAVINVTVSIDGLEAEHDRIRGRRGFFKLAMKTIKELKELQKRHERLEIGIRHTMLPGNYKELPGLYALSRELGVDFISKPATSGGLFENEEEFRLWHDNFTGKQREEAIETIQYIIDQEMKNLDIDRKRGIGKIKRAAGVLFLRYSIDFIKNPRKTIFPCYACFSSVFLDNEGNAMTCPVLYKKIGNVRERPFDEVWQGRPAVEARRFIKRGQCACYTNCNQLPSLVLSGMPRILSMILKDKIKRKPKDKG